MSQDLKQEITDALKINVEDLGYQQTREYSNRLELLVSDSEKRGVLKKQTEASELEVRSLTEEIHKQQA